MDEMDIAQNHPRGLFLRERKPAGKPRGVVLFVHGATVASVLFDLPVPGYSLLDLCSGAGWWAFAVDLRGYAQSPKPAAMDLPPVECPVVCTAEEADIDVGSTIDYLCAATGFDALTIVGGSWGSVTVGRRMSRTSRGVHRLVLLSPLYGTRNPSWLQGLVDPASPDRLNPAFGGYRVTREANLLGRWDAEIPAGQVTARRDPEVLNAMLSAELAADAKFCEPGAFRVPNGTLADLFEIFNGRPVFDAGAIKLPCLVVRGSDDQTSTHEDILKLYAALGSIDKRHITIPDAGHFVQAERQAPLLHKALLEFLDGGAR